MLFGAVPYLNSIPLIRGLNYDIRQAPPAALDRLLKLGEIDVATAPVTSLFENPEWRALHGIAIGTKQDARSVLLCMRSPQVTLESVRSIYLDMESRTSALLVKALLALKYGRDLREIQFITPLPSSNVEAKLLIGDKALREQVEASWTGPIYDLGTEWTQWTQLPFVFACWATTEAHVEATVVADLQRTVRQNLNNLDDWIGEIKDFDKSLIREYYCDNMNYEFGRLEQQGLMTFHQQLRELELVNKPFDLRFINP